MKLKFFKNNSGFALLFSVMVSSLLLTIGLSIFGIALKELAISTAARESIHAFFAADSGRECAIYWDIKRGHVPTFSNPSGQQITCGGQVIIFSPEATNNNIASEIGGADSPIKGLPDSLADFYVKIVKNWTNEGADIMTTITSYGHDSSSDDRVERAIEQTY